MRGLWYTVEVCKVTEAVELQFVSKLHEQCILHIHSQSLQFCGGPIELNNNNVLAYRIIELIKAITY